MSKLYFKIHIFNKITQNEIPNKKRKFLLLLLNMIREGCTRNHGLYFMVINLNKNIHGFGKSMTISWKTAPQGHRWMREIPPTPGQAFRH